MVLGFNLCKADAEKHPVMRLCDSTTPGDPPMADRKQFITVEPADAELLRLLEETRDVVVTEEQLREQRISFAYGNDLRPDASSKESVRLAAQYLSFANRRAAEARE